MAYARIKIMKTGIIPMTQSGAILGRPGQYKSPPFLMMPGNPVIEEVTLYDFQVNEIPEPEDLNNIPDDYGKELVEVSQRTVKGYTYYCDLDADADWDDTPMWDGSKTAEKKACLEARNMTGDGSQANPWKNLTYALEQLQCFIKTQCCRYIRLVCTGTAHYTACAYSSVTYRYTDFSGDGIFILDGANMELSRDGSGGNFFSYCFETCKNSIFYNCTARWKNETSNASAYPILYGFNSCDNSVFYNCTAEVECDLLKSVSCFEACENSIFYNCTAKATTKASSGHSIGANLYGFRSCYNSIFYNCTAEVRNVSGDIASYAYLYGFNSCDNSTFYNCTANVESNYTDSYAYLYGFYNCDNNILYNCTAEAATTEEINSNANVYGFYNCSNNILYNCTAKATAERRSRFAYGFYNCQNSTFYGCTAEAESNYDYGDDTQAYAYGFHSCFNSTFYGCTAIAECSYTNSHTCVAFAYGFYNHSNNSSILENFTYSVSAAAKSIPDSFGNFKDHEEECGIHQNFSCIAGYRCEIRTKSGTESC